MGNPASWGHAAHKCRGGAWLKAGRPHPAMPNGGCHVGAKGKSGTCLETDRLELPLPMEDVALEVGGSRVSPIPWELLVQNAGCGERATASARGDKVTILFDTA